MTEERVPNRRPDVIWRSMDDGVVLVLPEQGEVRVLNEVGTFIWHLIDGTNSLQAIVSILVEKYDVLPGRARRDLQAFLEQLEARQLISWESGHRHRA